MENTRLRNTLVIILLSILLGACRAFERVDTVGTLEAEQAAMQTEVIDIETASVVEKDNIAGTVVAAESTMALINGVNMQLIATLQRNVTPTPNLAVGQQLDSTQQAEFAGRRLFVKTGMSTEINNEDGCVTVPQLNFSVNEDRIYATAIAYNIESGVPLSSQWYYENELVYEFDFTTDQSYDEWCFYFYIDPDIVEFRPGSWSVRLFAEGFQLEEPMGFTMEAAMDDM